MTEQEAQELIAAARTQDPQFRLGLTLYRLNTSMHRRGLPQCVEVYRLTKSLKRAVFDHMTTIDGPTHPDVREWLLSR